MFNLTDDQMQTLTCAFISLAIVILLYKIMTKERFEYSLQDYVAAGNKNPGPGPQLYALQQAKGIVGLNSTMDDKNSVDMNFIGANTYQGQFSDLTNYLGQNVERPYVNNQPF